MRIIAGDLAKRLLSAPKDDATRPTSDRARESLFNILTHLEENFFFQKRILDLFAGTGALGLEALSRGAKNAYFVETSVKARAVIQENIENLHLAARTAILRRDATMLGERGKFPPFDIIFADPPYGKSLGEQAFLSVMAGSWVAENAFFILEECKDAQILPIKGLQFIQKKILGKSIFYIYKKI